MDGKDKAPDVDIELDNNNKPASKEVVIARKQTLGEKIIAKSEMLKNLDGDKLHVCILLFLYCLQGIPLGLKSSIPLILTRRSVPYTEQARFTIASYPFSMKVHNTKLVNDILMRTPSGSLGPNCGLRVLGQVWQKEILAGAGSVRHR